MGSTTGSHWGLGRIYFKKKRRFESLQPGPGLLAIDIFKPQLESGISKCFSWLNGLFLGR
jgi:hypothetical protein